MTTDGTSSNGAGDFQLANTCHFLFFGNSHSYRCGVMLDCSSDTHFPADHDLQHVFLNLSAICNVFPGKTPSQSLSSFFNWVFWFAFLLSCVRVFKEYIVDYTASVLQYRTSQVVKW